jgi:arylamine N-acetyltransferase
LLRERIPLQRRDRKGRAWTNRSISTNILPGSATAAHASQRRRLGLFNNRFSIHHPDGRTERRTLCGPDEIVDVLEQDFRMVLPTPRDALLEALSRALA